MSWNWRQRKARLLLGVAVVACALAITRPAAAHAGYPLASEARVALGFGATYKAADATSSSTHRGVDLVADSGAHVTAPFAGTVTFAGRVPAVGGGTVRAVTLSTAEGSVTLLPLGSLSVTKGDSIAEGDAVGLLAGGGDGSSACTHLHVGLKRGDLYVDPMTVLALPIVAPEPGGAAGGAVVAQGSASAAGAAARSSAGARSASTAGATARNTADARATSRSLAGRPAGAPSAALLRAVPGARLAPGVTIGGVAPQAAPSAIAAAAHRALAPLHGVENAPAQARASAQAAGLMFDSLLAQARRTAGQAARVAGMGAAAVLGGIGLLWPLWRRQEEKGSGEDRVSAISDDVAAAVGR